MKQNEILKSFVNLEGNGRKLVELKRIAPVAWYSDAGDVDVFDFDNHRIYANIPCWQDAEGNLTSIRTGKPVRRLSRLDQICVIGKDKAAVGSSFDYDDIKVIYTRRWIPGQRQPEYFFTIRECRDCEVVHHRAFGEEINEVPKIK